MNPPPSWSGVLQIHLYLLHLFLEGGNLSFQMTYPQDLIVPLQGVCVVDADHEVPLSLGVIGVNIGLTKIIVTTQVGS